MGLGLGSNLTKGGLTTPGIITDNLVLKHNYSSNGNIPVSDGAAFFDNTDDYITIPEITFSWHDTPYTISFWAYRNQIDDWDIVLGNDSVSNYNFIIFDDTNGDRIIVEGSDADNSNITVSHSANEWHHYAIVSVGDGSTIAYQNGVQCTVSDTCDSDIVIHRIGRGSGNPFGGYICNVGMWGRALTQEEVKSIMWKNYAGLTDTEKTSMLRWYNLDSTASNVSSNWAGGTGDIDFVLDNHNTSLGSNLLSSDQATGSGWTTNYGGSGTDWITSPSTDRYKSSPYSVKFEPESTDDGITSAAFTSTTGKIYEVRLWAYVPLSSASSFRIKWFRGDNGGSDGGLNRDPVDNSHDINFTPSAANQWEEYVGYFEEQGGGASANLVITCGSYNPASSGIVTYYVDDITVREYQGNTGRCR